MKSAHPELTVFLILFLCMFTGCEDQNVTSIEITNPEKGDVFNSGEYVTIKWEATGSVYETYCVVNGGVVGRTSGSAGSYKWRARSDMVGGMTPISAHVTTASGKEAQHTIIVTVNP
jgi:hypothetical protein